MVTLDKPDFKTIRNLADAYGIPFNDMLVACINKGICVIGNVVTKMADERDTDSKGDSIS